MEREYTVIANTREDLPALEAEITASSGAGPIPNRSVDIANPRPGSKIQTHFMLTDEEAEELRKDSRVRAVEIPPDQRDDIQIGLHATQDSNFYRAALTNTNYVNWGLRRVIESTNVYGSSPTTLGSYQYALDGTGVDVVIQDSGIDAGHPDFQDAEGNTRIQEIDWYAASGIAGTQDVNFYTDYDGHGTHCASIAAGKTYGWAKGAHIYAQKLEGLEGSNDPGTGISITNAFDCIRLWHNAKVNGRPTVVNMSWGYSATITDAQDPVSGTYRGTAWTWGVDYDDRNTLWAVTGVSINAFYDGVNYYFRIPSRVASVDAEIEDMIADGIHVCIAAGNNFHKADVVGGDDYDNSVTFSGSSLRYYHRGSSPYSDNAFMVGNINSSTISSVDRTSSTSTRGPGVNIWAPGTDIHAACSSNSYRIGNSYVTQYPDDNNFYIMRISGTSMASPQVAGLCALHLQVKPNLTPAQLKDRIIADSKAVIYTTGSDTDYSSISDTILGSPNRFLYSRYGAQPVTVNNSTAIVEIGLS